MNYAEAIAELARLGTEQNRKVYPRHGVREPLFGVSYQHLDLLAKKAKRDTALALELWASGVHDARVLATKIAVPAELEGETLEGWTRDLDNYVLTDAFSKIAAETPGALEHARRWIESDDEWVGRAGWTALAILLGREGALTDDEARALLPVIEQRIGAAKNRVKDAMLNALIAVGGRNEALGEEAVAASARIGKVSIDHGETGCKTPNPEPMIRKILARKAARG